MNINNSVYKIRGFTQTIITSTVIINNSESQYIRFNNEYEQPPTVIMSIVGKPNSDGNIYISNIDNYGFEIRSNRDRLYDIASAINYIVIGESYFNNEITEHYAKVDNIRGDILAVTTRQHDDFYKLTEDAFHKIEHNNKIMVNVDSLDLNKPIQVQDLIDKKESIDSFKLSTKNRLLHELQDYISSGDWFDVEGGCIKIPFTDKDENEFLNTIQAFNIYPTEEIYVLLSNGEVLRCDRINSIMQVYKYLKERKERLIKTYLYLLSVIEQSNSIDELRSLTIDDNL